MTRERSSEQRLVRCRVVCPSHPTPAHSTSPHPAPPHRSSFWVNDCAGCPQGYVQLLKTYFPVGGSIGRPLQTPTPGPLGPHFLSNKPVCWNLCTPSGAAAGSIQHSNQYEYMPMIFPSRQGNVQIHTEHSERLHAFEIARQEAVAARARNETPPIRSLQLLGPRAGLSYVPPAPQRD